MLVYMSYITKYSSDFANKWQNYLTEKLPKKCKYSYANADMQQLKQATHHNAIITLCASCGAVYYNRSCLFVCGSVTAITGITKLGTEVAQLAGAEAYCGGLLHSLLVLSYWSCTVQSFSQTGTTNKRLFLQAGFPSRHPTNTVKVPMENCDCMREEKVLLDKNGPILLSQLCQCLVCALTVRKS